MGPARKKEHKQYFARGTAQYGTGRLRVNTVQYRVDWTADFGFPESGVRGPALSESKLSRNRTTVPALGRDAHRPIETPTPDLPTVILRPSFCWLWSPEFYTVLYGQGLSCKSKTRQNGQDETDRPIKEQQRQTLLG